MSMTVAPHVRELFSPYIPRFRQFYLSKGQALSEMELFQETERTFGEELAKTVCLELGLDDGACLIVAMALMKEP